jgi:hypothetical protein
LVTYGAGLAYIDTDFMQGVVQFDEKVVHMVHTPTHIYQGT